MQRYDHRFTALGGPCRFRLDASDEAAALVAIDAAEAEVRRIEQKYSRYQTDSVVSRINSRAGEQTISIDQETAYLLNYANTLWQQSGGLFDITAGILRRAWNFQSGKLPRQSEIELLLPNIKWSKVEWNKESIRLPSASMEIDFGGFGKEYACDCAINIFKANALNHALVDLAGDIAVAGTQADGTPWTIGVRDPADKAQALAEVHINQGGMASSGDYERCIISDGRRYGHILNPHTGWPVEGLIAVSVLAEQCLVAGSICTLALLKPEQEALTWLADLGVSWLAIDRQQQPHVSIAPANAR